MLDIFSNRETLGVTKVLPAMSSISLSLRRAFILVRTSLCHASRILETLFETAGVQSFLLAVDPADAADAGFLGGSLTGREFWRRMRNGGETGARAFKTYCIKEMPASQPPFEQGSSADVTDAPETTVKRTTAKNVKSELYEKAREALRRVSGVRNAEMKWTNPERLDAYGVRLVGWPREIPAQNPSSLKQSQNKKLLQALENGALRFERVVEQAEDHAEESAELGQDFSWADAEPVHYLPDEEASFDYGEFLNPSEMFLETVDLDLQPPPVKRARANSLGIERMYYGM
ncbi:hypothetical protein AX14_000304 [Amanita brunnescens Koide BX004]|nr:hypothetical protein AX14_000304 [Amanita brunnescens Koide BX004]